DIRDENAEIQKRIQLEEDRKKALKGFLDLNQQIQDIMKSGIENEKQMERERAEAAEKRQKEYAEAEKKRQEEAKRRAEEAFREEIARNNELFEIYKLNNDGKLKIDGSFSLNSILTAKKYLDTLYQMELDKAAKSAKLDFDEVKRKYDNGEKLTSDELKLIKYSLQLQKENADAKKKIDEDLAAYMEKRATDNFEAEKKRLSLDLRWKITSGEDKLKAEREYQDELYKLNIEHFEVITGLTEKEIEDKYTRNETLTEAENEYLKIILDK